VPLLIVSLLSSTAIGYLLARVFLPVYEPAWTDLLLKVSLGAGLGAGVTSIFYFFTRILIGPSRVVSIATEFLLLAAAASVCWLAHSKSIVIAEHAAPRGLLWYLLPFFVASLAMAVPLFWDSSASNPYGAWDAWAIWNQRARFLAQPNESWRRAFSPVLNQIAGAGAAHPDYPVLLSGYVARCWTWMGSIGDVAAPIATAAMFSAATIGVLVSTLAMVRGWSTAMIAGLILLGTAFQLICPWQYADVPIGFYYLSTFALILLADANSKTILVLAGTAMGFAAWTKNEGLLFVLLVTCAVGVYSWMSGNWRWILLFTMGAAAPVIIAVWFKFFMAPPTGTFGQASLSDTIHRLVEWSRYLKILKSFWVEGIAQGAGLAHPILCLAAMGVFLKVSPARLRQPVMICLLGALLAMCAGYFYAFVVTPLDLTWHLNTSLERLYAQLWPSLLLLVPAVFRTAEEVSTVASTRRPDKAASRTKNKKMRR
jgi:hypothetical protein